MVNFLLYALAAVGMSHVLVEGKITEPLRDFLQARLPDYLFHLIRCYQCNGFWFGLLAGSLTFSHWWQVFLAGFGGAFLSPLAANVMNYLEAQSMVEVNVRRD